MASEDESYFDELLEISPFLDDFLRGSSDEDSDIGDGKN